MKKNNRSLWSSFFLLLCVLQGPLEAAVSIIDAPHYCKFLNAHSEAGNGYDEKMATDITGRCLVKIDSSEHYYYQPLLGEEGMGVPFLSYLEVLSYLSWIKEEERQEYVISSTKDFDIELKSNKLIWELTLLSEVATPSIKEGSKEDVGEILEDLIKAILVIGGTTRAVHEFHEEVELEPQEDLSHTNRYASENESFLPQSEEEERVDSIPSTTFTLKNSMDIHRFSPIDSPLFNADSLRGFPEQKKEIERTSSSIIVVKPSASSFDKAGKVSFSTRKDSESDFRGHSITQDKQIRASSPLDGSLKIQQKIGTLALEAPKKPLPAWDPAQKKAILTGLLDPGKERQEYLTKVHAYWQPHLSEIVTEVKKPLEEAYAALEKISRSAPGDISLESINAATQPAMEALSLLVKSGTLFQDISDQLTPLFVQGSNLLAGYKKVQSALKTDQLGTVLQQVKARQEVKKANALLLKKVEAFYQLRSERASFANNAQELQQLDQKEGAALAMLQEAKQKSSVALMNREELSLSSLPGDCSTTDQEAGDYMLQISQEALQINQEIIALLEKLALQK